MVRRLLVAGAGLMALCVWSFPVTITLEVTVVDKEKTKWTQPLLLSA